MSQELPYNLTLVRFADIPTTYHALLTMYPLRPIHNDVELEQATAMLDLMAGHTLNGDQSDYLDVLSTLVAAYEDLHDPVAEPAMCGREALRALLADHGMGAADLARLLQVHRSMGSKLLRGERTLTARRRRMLSERFKVHADLFLEHQNRQACEPW